MFLLLLLLFTPIVCQVKQLVCPANWIKVDGTCIFPILAQSDSGWKIKLKPAVSSGTYSIESFNISLIYFAQKFQATMNAQPFVCFFRFGDWLVGSEKTLRTRNAEPAQMKVILSRSSDEPERVRIGSSARLDQTDFGRKVELKIDWQRPSGNRVTLREINNSVPITDFLEPELAIEAAAAQAMQIGAFIDFSLPNWQQCGGVGGEMPPAIQSVQIRLIGLGGVTLFDEMIDYRKFSDDQAQSTFARSSSAISSTVVPANGKTASVPSEFNQLVPIIAVVGGVICLGILMLLICTIFARKRLSESQREDVYQPDGYGNGPPTQRSSEAAIANPGGSYYTKAPAPAIIYG